MDDNKRYNVHGFTALSGLLEHVAVLQESDSAAVPPEHRRDNRPASSELHHLLFDIQHKLGRVVELLAGSHERPVAVPRAMENHERNIYEPAGGAPVDGVYDGEGNMVADDGSRHRIPPQYVKKALLQEGDLMQFTTEGTMKKFKKMRNY